MSKICLSELKWLFLDVDGVLTDGRLFYSPTGEKFKIFNVKDGLGLKRLKATGVKVGVISGRGNKALLNRLEELKIDEIIMNRPDKGNVFKELTQKIGNDINYSAIIGDDLPDLELFRLCAVSIAVKDAIDAVKDMADIVLTKDGGDGAVREACELIIDKMVDRNIVN
jgi:3-deoxy-D-manno-octulosonate 8-phosphate phosphatase (KDO 8-P phosphatase)